MDTLQAAILSAKLPHLDVWNEKRRGHAKRYEKLLSKIPEIVLPDIGNHGGIKSVVYVYQIQTDNRDGLQRYLDSQGIETNIHYPTPIHLQPAMSLFDGGGKGKFPVAESLAKRTLSLPMFPELRNEEIDYVCEKIKDFFS